MVRKSKINKKLVGIVILVLSIFLIKGSNITSKLDINNSNKTNLKESGSSNSLYFINLEDVSLSCKIDANNPAANVCLNEDEYSDISGKYSFNGIDSSIINNVNLKIDKYSSNSQLITSKSYELDKTEKNDNNSFSVDTSNENILNYYTDDNADQVFDGYYDVYIDFTVDGSGHIFSNHYIIKPLDGIIEEGLEPKWIISEPISISKITLNFVAGDKGRTKEFYDVAGKSDSKVNKIELLVYKNGNLYKKVESYPAADWSTNVGEDSTTDYLLDKTYNGLYTIVAKATINNTQYYSTYKTLEDITPGKIEGVEDNYSLKVGETLKLTPQVTGDDSNTSFKYSVTNGTDIVSVDDNGLITAKKSGVATIQITKGEYGYNNEAAFTKNIYITVTSDIENRDLKILNNEIKKDIYELYNEDSVNINLFIPDKENIKTIDMAKIKLIPDNHNADIGVLKKEINESSNSDGSNYTLKLSGFYNKENNAQKFAGLVIEKGAITYSDNSTNEELEYNNISINIKKILVNQNDGKVLEDGKTYKSAITPISLVDNLDFRGSYNIVLKKNNIEIEDYELGQSITENGNYELKFNCVDYDTNNEITYNFTIDIDEIELLTPTSALNEFVDDLELHLKIKDINNFRSMDISKVKFYEYDGTELSFKADVMGKTCDNCNGYNYVITYKNIINPDNYKYPTVSKIKFESGAIIYYDKNNKQYSESNELENNVNITINPFDQSQPNSFNGSYTPQMNNVNDDDYVFLLYKDNKRIKDYEYGNEISDPGTYILKVLYNNAIYTKKFTINDPVFIELNSDVKDLELNSNVITLYKTNTVTEFKSNFKTLNAKLYKSDAKLENNNVTGTEISDKNYVTTGSKVILNRKNKTENDIYTIVVMGDVDKNGEVTVNDITNLRSYFNQIANNETITYDKYQIAAMDVDKNNDIGVNDITRMRSYIVKIINSFKVANENE